MSIPAWHSMAPNSHDSHTRHTIFQLPNPSRVSDHVKDWFSRQTDIHSGYPSFPDGVNQGWTRIIQHEYLTFNYLKHDTSSQNFLP